METHDDEPRTRYVHPHEHRGMVERMLKNLNRFNELCPADRFALVVAYDLISSVREIAVRPHGWVDGPVELTEQEARGWLALNTALQQNMIPFAAIMAELMRPVIRAGGCSSCWYRHGVKRLIDLLDGSARESARVNRAMYPIPMGDDVLILPVFTATWLIYRHDDFKTEEEAAPVLGDIGKLMGFAIDMSKAWLDWHASHEEGGASGKA